MQDKVLECIETKSYTVFSERKDDEFGAVTEHRCAAVLRVDANNGHLGGEIAATTSNTRDNMQLYEITDIRERDLYKA